ncbi:MAG: NTP transferase domain-containing protein [Hyphomicrobiales bacterium]|nr:NTP transferase domain-containing protein [Hyphomicrobiales bacterium]
MTVKIVPVLLSGGAGTRLWPASSAGVPKPFLPLVGGRSTFAATLARVADPVLFANPMVVARIEHQPLIAAELSAAGTRATLVLEPEAMSTTAAIAAAAAATNDPDDLLLFLAADHVIRNDGEFRKTVATARPAVESGHIVIFGIKPDSPQTGYGYIRPGAGLDNIDRVFEVAAFVEKPDTDRATTLIAEGSVWNSGNFFVRAATALDEIERLAPVTAAAATTAVEQARRDGDIISLAREPFITAQPISFDRAVLEKTDRAAVIAAGFDWADVGTWASIWNISEHDNRGNVIVGNATTIDTDESLVSTDGPRVGVIGMSDAIVVAANGAILVAPRAKADIVRGLVDTFSVRRAGGIAAEVIDAGGDYHVTRLVIDPGARYASPVPVGSTAHWTVVVGSVDVTVDGAVRSLAAGQSVTFASGMAPNAVNRAESPATIIVASHGNNRERNGIIT